MRGQDLYQQQHTVYMPQLYPRGDNNNPQVYYGHPQVQQQQTTEPLQLDRRGAQGAFSPIPFLAVAGLIFAASITPILSTEVLGMHSCDPLKYPAIGFASLTILGLIVMGGSSLGNRQSRRVVYNDHAGHAGPGRCAGVGKALAILGFVGTLACTLAGLGMIPQELLQETLSGRIFMLNGVAPAALDAGQVIGTDFGFAIGGAAIAGALVAIVFVMRKRAAMHSLASMDEPYLRVDINEQYTAI